MPMTDLAFVYTLVVTYRLTSYLNKGPVINNGEGGGATKREGGGASDVLPLQKKVGGGGAEKGLAMSKGHNKF